MAKVKEARRADVAHMQGRKLSESRPLQVCWDKSGEARVSMRWVDTNRGNDHDDEWEIRCRSAARDFKGGEKHRHDSFAEAPPLEAKRFLISRAMTRRRDGKSDQHWNLNRREKAIVKRQTHIHDRHGTTREN